MPPQAQSKAEEAKAEAKRAEDRVQIDRIYGKYAAISKKLVEASAIMSQAVDMLLSLDKEIGKFDSSGKLAIRQRLRLKIIFGAVYPVKQHLDRLVTRMNVCASSAEAVVRDAERPEPAFE